MVQRLGTWLFAWLAVMPVALAGAEPLLRFIDQVPPAPPDYAQAKAWAARPDAQGAAAAVPPNATPAVRAPRADIFYVHPTTFKHPKLWNQPLDDAATNAWTDESVVARQAGLFNSCCRVFAPRYRQAEIRSFASMNGDGGRAYALAYEDVLRAFDYYIANDNHGRPFILAGHSQGAFHLQRLLKERVAGTPLAKRMVAAYVVGIILYEGDLGKGSKALRPCRSPRQTGCVLSWNSWLAGSDTSAYVRRGRAAFEANHGPGTAGPMLCNNPVTLDGKKRGRGAGTLPPSAGWALPALVPGAAKGACDANGVLEVILDPRIGLSPLPGGNMHYHDFALFYAEVRADAARRVAAFR